MAGEFFGTAGWERGAANGVVQAPACCGSQLTPKKLLASASASPMPFPRSAGWVTPFGTPGPLDNVSLGVIPVIDGDLLNVGDPAQVTEADRMLATLHDAMAAYPHHIGGGPSARHEQLVHNEFRSANVLHDGTSITAVLDFEEVTYRSRVSDLAKATALLGTRFHDWGPTSQLTREAFVGAYCDQAPLTNAEQNQLQSAIEAVMKHFGWA
jgi:homoserine kinase type II